MGLYDKKVMNIKTMTVNKSYPKVETITVSNNTLSLEPGQNHKLTVSFVPEKTTQKGVVWTTSNPDYATVENGNVVAVADGEVTIKVTSTENVAIYDECIVTVTTPLV